MGMTHGRGKKLANAGRGGGNRIKGESFNDQKTPKGKEDTLCGREITGRGQNREGESTERRGEMERLKKFFRYVRTAKIKKHCRESLGTEGITSKNR